MQIFSHLLRQQYIQALAGISLNGIIIPVNDEVLTSTPAMIQTAECYIILTNQTVNEAPGTKCGEAYLATIQVDVVTKFRVNSGAKLTSELIAAEAVKRLLADPVQIQGLNVRRCRLVTQRGVREDSDAYRIYRNILVFSHNINE